MAWVQTGRVHHRDSPRVGDGRTPPLVSERQPSQTRAVAHVRAVASVCDWRDQRVPGSLVVEAVVPSKHGGWAWHTQPRAPPSPPHPLPHCKTPRFCV
jgi:hypothetical protein